MRPLTHTPSEQRAWEAAHAPESLCPAESWHYMTAENSSGQSIARDLLAAQDADDYCTQVDATADRGSLAERAAGWLLALLGAAITVGALVALVQIVGGWLA